MTNLFNDVVLFLKNPDSNIAVFDKLSMVFLKDAIEIWPDTLLQTIQKKQQI